MGAAEGSSLARVFKGGPDGDDPVGGVIDDSAGNFVWHHVQGRQRRRWHDFHAGSNGTKTILHNFSGPDGATPNAALVRDSSGNLYGTTREGGTSKVGTVFRLAPSGSLTVLHSFQVARMEPIPNPT